MSTLIQSGPKQQMSATPENRTSLRKLAMLAITLSIVNIAASVAESLLELWRIFQ